MPISFPNFLQVSALVTAGVVVPPALAGVSPSPLVYANLDGNGLRIDWDVERTRTASYDTGTITIYNMGLPALLALKTYIGFATAPINALLPLNVEFSLGWGGLVEKILVGKPWVSKLGQRIGTDVVTTLTISDGATTGTDASLGASFAEMFVETALLLVVSAPPPNGLGWPIDPASKALITARIATLPIKKTNFIEQGNTVETVDGFMATLGLEWKVHNGKFIAMDKGNAATANPLATVLKAGGGLISWEQLDNGGISCRALANPNVSPGSQIVVLDAFGVPVGSPAFRVERIRFTGTTIGESIMEIEARKSVLL